MMKVRRLRCHHFSIKLNITIVIIRNDKKYLVFVIAILNVILLNYLRQLCFQFHCILAPYNFVALKGCGDVWIFAIVSRGARFFCNLFHIVWRYIDQTPCPDESDSDLRKNFESRLVWHEHYTAKQKLGFRRGFIRLITSLGHVFLSPFQEERLHSVS